MFNLFLHNYRSFQKQKLNFSRVNIFIGENSGGKSSLLKLLLTLKQTLDSPSEVNLKLSGDLTDLGNFDEVVYYKKKNRKIVVGFDDELNYNSYFEDFLGLLDEHENLEVNKANTDKLKSEFANSKTSILFEFSSKLNEHSSIKTVIKNSKLGSVEILQAKGKEDAIGRQLTCDVIFNFEDEQGVISNCGAAKEGFLTLIEPEIKIKCKKYFGNRGDYFFYKIAYFLVFQNYLQDQIDKIRFVNPIGTSPKRFYFQEDKKANYKSIDIEKFINILSDKTLSEKGYKNRINLLNKTLKSFGIADQIDIIRDKQLPVLALNVKTKDFWSNITDVGYGVSLQIPILFQALLSEHYTKGQTLLIEQPEVHLHPSLQAKFIETLLGIGNKNTYFIETHSEHIIRKLQILVKKKEFGLRPEDITIHYFKRDPLKFSITSHTINSSGQLMPAFPAGFFDTSYSLVKQLL
ncbi:MAG: DUF3696 domain-containing protein [Bacteroidia bacterium]|nr:DUF3696 domain-containing protein [Bacteroidia bacterium]